MELSKILAIFKQRTNLTLQSRIILESLLASVSVCGGAL